MDIGYDHMSVSCELGLRVTIILRFRSRRGGRAQGRVLPELVPERPPLCLISVASSSRSVTECRISKTKGILNIWLPYGARAARTRMFPFQIILLQCNRGPNRMEPRQGKYNEPMPQSHDQESPRVPRKGRRNRVHEFLLCPLSSPLCSLTLEFSGQNK